LSGLCYLDSSAFVKVLTAEPESAALRRFLQAQPAQVSSVLLDVEAHRVAARLGTVVATRTAQMLAGIALAPITPEVRSLARTLPPPSLRSLDAIHLATALALGSDLGVFVAYDRRLLDAAADAGLTVKSPTGPA
jgi:predicted nucleic acid-binding protein